MSTHLEPFYEDAKDVLGVMQTACPMSRVMKYASDMAKSLIERGHYTANAFVNFGAADPESELDMAALYATCLYDRQVDKAMLAPGIEETDEWESVKVYEGVKDRFVSEHMKMHDILASSDCSKLSDADIIALLDYAGEQNAYKPEDIRRMANGD